MAPDVRGIARCPRVCGVRGPVVNCSHLQYVLFVRTSAAFFKSVFGEERDANERGGPCCSMVKVTRVVRAFPSCPPRLLQCRPLEGHGIMSLRMCAGNVNPSAACPSCVGGVCSLCRRSSMLALPIRAFLP